MLKKEFQKQVDKEIECMKKFLEKYKDKNIAWKKYETYMWEKLNGKPAELGGLNKAELDILLLDENYPISKRLNAFFEDYFINL